MNEKINELMLEATKDMPETYYWPGQYVEKFAELIVRECLEACSRANEIRHFIPPTQQQVVLNCMDEIERTFWS